MDEEFQELYEAMKEHMEWERQQALLEQLEGA